MTKFMKKERSSFVFVKWIIGIFDFFRIFHCYCFLHWKTSIIYQYWLLFGNENWLAVLITCLFIIGQNQVTLSQLYVCEAGTGTNSTNGQTIEVDQLTGARNSTGWKSITGYFIQLLIFNNLARWLRNENLELSIEKKTAEGYWNNWKLKASKSENRRDRKVKN